MHTLGYNVLYCWFLKRMAKVLFEIRGILLRNCMRTLVFQRISTIIILHAIFLDCVGHIIIVPIDPDVLQFACKMQRPSHLFLIYPRRR